VTHRPIDFRPVDFRPIDSRPSGSRASGSRHRPGRPAAPPAQPIPANADPTTISAGLLARSELRFSPALQLPGG